MKPTLNVFLVPNNSNSALRRQAVALTLGRYGFDVLRHYRTQHVQLLNLISVGASAALSRRRFDVFVTVDLQPLPPEPRRDHLHASIDNGRLRYLAGVAREVEFRLRNVGERSEIPCSTQIWVTPNSETAWAVIASIRPGLLGSLRTEIETLANAMVHPFKVLRTLSRHGTDARTDLVQIGSRRAVCKIFRPGRESRLANETSVRQLTDLSRVVPPIENRGDNWILMAYYDRHISLRKFCRWTPRFGRRLVPLGAARVFIDSLCRLHEAGYANLDLSRSNVLVGPGGDLKLIDFERLQPVDPTASILDSPMITGYNVTQFLDGVPKGEVLKHFDARFLEALGAGIEVFLTGSLREQVVARGLFSSRRFASRIKKSLRRRGAPRHDMT
jgi:hypothetical protein